MTSWISAPLPKKKVAPEPVSLFPLLQGTFEKKTTHPTLVTALYDYPDSTSFEQRKQWMKRFLEETATQILVFTESHWADELAACREDWQSRTRIVVLEQSEWVSKRKFIPQLWTQQVKQDPELRLNRTLEQFQFGYEKKEFLVKATEMNPFNSVDFVWIDPSIVAGNSSLTPYLTFPLGDKIPTDRIVVLNPEPFTADDVASSYFRGKNRVDNKIMAASAQQWREYAKLYDVVMTLKLKISQFVGDDLLMLHYVILQKPNLFCLVNQSSLLSYLSD